MSKKVAGECRPTSPPSQDIRPARGRAGSGELISLLGFRIDGFDYNTRGSHRTMIGKAVKMATSMISMYKKGKIPL